MENLKRILGIKNKYTYILNYYFISINTFNNLYKSTTGKSYYSLIQTFHLKRQRIYLMKNKRKYETSLRHKN